MKNIILAFFLFLPISFLAGTKVYPYQDRSCESENKWEVLLGLPPVPGSIEEQQDVATLIHYQESRTEAECNDASKEESISLKSFFGGASGPLTEVEVKRLQFFFFKYFLKAGIPSTFAKNHFKRDRPFVSFPTIKPCIKMPKGLSYPSGHSTIGRLMAHALSVKYPERSALFMKRADEIAEHRMLGGVHYPSDVKAGKVLADYLARKFFEDKAFVDELLFL